MADRRLAVIVLAAGEGTRMKSRRAKVLHEVAGRPMLDHVLDVAERLSPERIVLVAGSQADSVAKAARGHSVVRQEQRLGTAHAVGCARDVLADFSGDVLIMYADTPLVTDDALAALRQALTEPEGSRNALAVLGFRADDPSGYGRLVTSAEAGLERIVEPADATAAEQAITLCNAGLMAFDSAALWRLLAEIDNANAKGEYYLTDAVRLARHRGETCGYAEAAAAKVMGVNSRADLAQAEAAMQARLRSRAMAGGATLVDPATTYLSWDTEIGRDVYIEPGVVIGAGTVIADNAQILAYSHVSGSHIGPGSRIGPFARLRPGTLVADGARIGNFVETKNAHFAAGAKANHLSYVGDAEVGEGANIGAGTITCNYDGFRKARTTIGAQAFIGSNTALVAPVRVGQDAIVGAGATVTAEVPDNALAIARAEQKTLPDGARRLRARRRDAEESPGG